MNQVRFRVAYIESDNNLLDICHITEKFKDRPIVCLT